MIKIAIFDLDGTLINSDEVILGAFRHALSSHGKNHDDIVLRSHVGKLLEHSYQTLAPELDSILLIELHRTWQAENKHLVKDFDGTKQLLRSLKKQGLKIAAFTSARRLRTDTMLEITGIDKYFDKVICGDEVVSPKPHQEGIETILKQMNLKPEEAVMIGDSEYDIRSGKNAGVLTIGITHGFGTVESLIEAGADYIVNNLRELLKTIQKLDNK